MADWHDRRVRGEIPGRVGGQSRSHAKARAARENGRLGGRPKNKTKLQLAEKARQEAEERAAAMQRRVAELEAQLAAAKPPEPPKPAGGSVNRFGLIELD